MDGGMVCVLSLVESGCGEAEAEHAGVEGEQDRHREHTTSLKQSSSTHDKAPVSDGHRGLVRAD
jgi:hypothetical protein